MVLSQLLSLPLTVYLVPRVMAKLGSQTEGSAAPLLPALPMACTLKSLLALVPSAESWSNTGSSATRTVTIFEWLWRFAGQPGATPSCSGWRYSAVLPCCTCTSARILRLGEPYLCSLLCCASRASLKQPWGWELAGQPLWLLTSLICSGSNVGLRRRQLPRCNRRLDHGPLRAPHGLHRGRHGGRADLRFGQTGLQRPWVAAARVRLCAISVPAVCVLEGLVVCVFSNAQYFSRLWSSGTSTLQAAARRLGTSPGCSCRSSSASVWPSL